MFSIGRTHQGSQEMTLIRLVRKLAEHVTPFPDVQAEGEMAPDNLYRMTVQLIKVCALSTLQRLCSSLLCSCSYWKVCLLAVNTRVSWSHFQLVLNALLPYVAQCCKSVQTTTRQNCSAPSHPPPPPPPSPKNSCQTSTFCRRSACSQQHVLFDQLRINSMPYAGKRSEAGCTMGAHVP